MSGGVLKRRFFGKNRILVITDLPRLLVLEPTTFKTVCEIPLTDSVNSGGNGEHLPTASLLSSQDFPSSASTAGWSVTLVSPTEFSIMTETGSWKGEVVDGSANAWVTLIQRLRQKAMKSASLRPPRPIRRNSYRETQTRELLSKPEIGSYETMGSLYSKKYSSDLPTHEEIEAEAEARVDAALKLVGKDITDANELVAVLEEQMRRKDMSPTPVPRRPKKSSCTIM
jgi:hypothetical protein